MIDPAAASGLFALGILCGILLVRWAGSESHKRFWNGKCVFCEKNGHLVRCRKCNRQVAMCHYYAILYPDDPGFKILGKRHSVEICSACIELTEREILEALERRCK